MATVAELRREAASRGIVPPQRRTLDRYGLDEVSWLRILHSQDWKCPICFSTHRKWNIDHFHRPGWAKLPPHLRKLDVRGITCWKCNRHLIGSKISSEMAQRVADYVRAWEDRRRKEPK